MVIFLFFKCFFLGGPHRTMVPEPQTINLALITYSITNFRQNLFVAFIEITFRKDTHGIFLLQYFDKKDLKTSLFCLCREIFVKLERYTDHIFKL